MHIQIFIFKFISGKYVFTLIIAIKAFNITLYIATLYIDFRKDGKRLKFKVGLCISFKTKLYKQTNIIKSEIQLGTCNRCI